jgi:hypothetical protein
MLNKFQKYLFNKSNGKFYCPLMYNHNFFIEYCFCYQSMTTFAYV